MNTKNKDIAGIYTITSPTGKIYIGSSQNIEQRWYFYKTLNCKGQPHVYRSLKKYGPETHQFDIFEYCSTDQLLLKEQKWLDFFKPELNCALSAIAPMRGRKHTAETLKKMSEAKKGKKRGPHSAEHRRNLSESLKGKTHSVEAKLKMSKAKQNMSAETKLKMSKAKQNMSAETKKKISEAKKGKKRAPFSAETKKKISEAQKEYWRKKALLKNGM